MRGRTKIAIVLALAGLIAAVAPVLAKQVAAMALKPTGAWTNVAPLPQSVFGGAAASDGTYMYFFGGYHFPAAPSTLDTVYRYNVATNTWTPLERPDAAGGARGLRRLLPADEQDLRLRRLDADARSAHHLRRDADLRHRDQHVDGGSDGAGPRSQMASGYNPANGKIYLNGGYLGGEASQRLQPDLGVRPGREHVRRQDAEPGHPGWNHLVGHGRQAVHVRWAHESRRGS